MSSRRRSLALLATLSLIALTMGVAQPASAALLSPTLTSVSPSQVVPGITGQTLTLNGDFLAGNATVSFGPATGLTISQAPAVSPDNRKITLKVDVAADAPNTARDVTVTQGLLNSSSTCTKCLNVGPAITGVSGPISNAGNSASFTITGQAFKAPATVKISRSAYGFGAAESDEIFPSEVNVTSSNTIVATVNPLLRAPGRWKVSVAQNNGGTASFGDGVTTGLLISGSKPTLSTLSPTRIDSNQTDKQFTVTGTGFAKGITATVSGSGVTQSAVMTVSSATSAVLKLTSTAAPSTGPRTLVLRNADGQSSTNADAICVNCNLTPPGGAPSVTSISPTILGQGASQVQMVVKGANFGSPVPVVTVSPNGTTDKKIDIGVTRDSSTQLTLTVSVGVNTPAGARSMTIENPGGGSVTKPNAFSINTDFQVTNLSPPGRPQGFDGTIAVNGSGFTGTPSVTITPGTGITIGTVVRDSSAKLTVPVKVAADAALGARDVTVQVGGASKVCDDCFTVGKTPTLTSIAPSSGNGGAKVSIAAITGTNFAPAAVASLERTGQPSIQMTDTSVDSATQISGTFDLTNAAPGKWALRVTNVDGGTALKAEAFEVALPSPTLTAADPDVVEQSAAQEVLRITGTAFAPGMVVSLPDPKGITVKETKRLTGTTADVTIDVAPTAALGSRDLKITNTDGKTGTCVSCFTVVQGQQSQIFGPGATVYENFNGGAFIAAGNVDAVPANGTEFVTAPNAGGGPHVRPYRINPANGTISELGGGFMAYDPNFTGGVHVAVGNVDGNAANGDEIITGAGPGGGPHVRVFHVNNDLTTSELGGQGFFAYAPSFTGGVWVAAGDVNGDGKDEIITGAGPGGGPHVRVFRLSANNQTFEEVSGWMAYSTAFGGGVAVTAGNLVAEPSGGPQFDEVATAPSQGGGPHVRIFRGNGVVLNEFLAFPVNDPGGYRLTAGDFNFDTVADLAVGRVTATEILVAQIIPPPAQFEALVTPNISPLGLGLPIGSNVAAADIDADGDTDLIVSPDHDSAVTIRLVRPLSSS